MLADIQAFDSVCKHDSNRRLFIVTYVSLHTESIVVFEKSKRIRIKKYCKNLSPKRLK